MDGNLGRHADVNLLRRGHTVPYLRVNTRSFGADLQVKKRTVHPNIQRASQGFPASDILISYTKLAECMAAEEKKEEEETAKASRKVEKENKRAKETMEAAKRQRGQRNGPGPAGCSIEGHGHGRRAGRGGRERSTTETVGSGDPLRLGWPLRVEQVLWRGLISNQKMLLSALNRDSRPPSPPKEMGTGRKGDDLQK